MYCSVNVEYYYEHQDRGILYAQKHTYTFTKDTQDSQIYPSKSIQSTGRRTYWTGIHKRQMNLYIFLFCFFVFVFPLNKASDDQVILQAIQAGILDMWVMPIISPSNGAEAIQHVPVQNEMA